MRMSRYIILSSLLWLSFLRLQADTFDPGRLTAVTLLEQLNQPMELAVAPDGQIFFIELNGEFRVLDPKKEEVTLIHKFEVARRGEVGLIGLALDPNFSQNNWVYLQYSPMGMTSQKTSRFTLHGNQIVEGSEKKLIEFHEPFGTGSHHAGSLEFGPDGYLYISTGDDTSPGGDSEGYAPIDDRPGQFRFSAEKSSSNPFSYNGKVLRIRPTDDGSYEIPEGNLFPRDGSKGLPEVYVMGCRNPWRININQKTGTLYFGDVGPDAYLEGERGPAGHDEINQVKQAGNFGWPYFVGNNFAYPMRDFNTSELHPPQNPQAPVNQSSFVENPITLPPANPAFIWYRSRGTPEFKELGTAGRTACAGPVFHYDPKLKSPTQLHSHFDNCLFIYEWTRNWVFTARLDEDEKLDKLEPFMPDYPFIRPIDMTFGPDGALYLIEYGTTWGKNDDAKLIRIDYLRGNRAPQIQLSANQTAGKAPLVVELSTHGTYDPDKGDQLTYEWSKVPGDGSILSTEPNPTLTFADFGNHQVKLTVRDQEGSYSESSLSISVGNSPPQVAFKYPQDGDFFEFGKPFAWKVDVSDQEDTKIDATRVTFQQEIRQQNGAPMPSTLRGEQAPGLNLMKKSDCFNCHSVDQKLVGPTFTEIAMRYDGVKKAKNEAAQRILNGSTGVWGQIPMMPHPQHNLIQAKQMVDWIFSLSTNDQSTQTGTTGSINPNRPDGFSGHAGYNLFLEASYLDRGVLPVAPLRGTQMIRLRSKTVHGSSANHHQGVTLNKSAVSQIGHGDFISFKNINLDGITKISTRVASGGAGGEIHLRLGSTRGEIIGKAIVQANGSWQDYFEQEFELEKCEGRHDLYVCFHNPGVSNGLMNLASLKFQ
jgi:cytochrome c